MPENDERRPHEGAAPRTTAKKSSQSVTPHEQFEAGGVAGLTATQVRLYLRLLGYRVVPCRVFAGESCVTCGPDVDAWLDALSAEVAAGLRW